MVLFLVISSYLVIGLEGSIAPGDGGEVPSGPSDHDWDGDGVLNDDDVFPRNPNEWADVDFDGFGDNWDAKYLEVGNNDGAVQNDDWDGDGLTNIREFEIGSDPNSVVVGGSGDGSSGESAETTTPSPVSEYRETPETSCGCPDLDGDGEVTISDMVMAAVDFGEGYIGDLVCVATRFGGEVECGEQVEVGDGQASEVVDIDEAYRDLRRGWEIESGDEVLEINLEEYSLSELFNSLGVSESAVVEVGPGIDPVTVDIKKFTAWFYDLGIRYRIDMVLEILTSVDRPGIAPRGVHANIYEYENEYGIIGEGQISLISKNENKYYRDSLEGYLNQRGKSVSTILNELKGDLNRPKDEFKHRQYIGVEEVEDSHLFSISDLRSGSLTFMRGSALIEVNSEEDVEDFPLDGEIFEYQFDEETGISTVTRHTKYLDYSGEGGIQYADNVIWEIGLEGELISRVGGRDPIAIQQEYQEGILAITADVVVGDVVEHVPIKGGLEKITGRGFVISSGSGSQDETDPLSEDVSDGEDSLDRVNEKEEKEGREVVTNVEVLPIESKPNVDDVGDVKFLYEVKYSTKDILLLQMDGRLADIIDNHVQGMFEAGYADSLYLGDLFHGHFYSLDPQFHLNFPDHPISLEDWTDIYLDGDMGIVYHTREGEYNDVPYTGPARSLLGTSDGEVRPMVPQNDDARFENYGTVFGDDPFLTYESNVGGVYIGDPEEHEGVGHTQPVDATFEGTHSEYGMILSDDPYKYGLFTVFMDENGRYDLPSGERYDIFYWLEERDAEDDDK